MTNNFGKRIGQFIKTAKKEDLEKHHDFEEFVRPKDFDRLKRWVKRNPNAKLYITAMGIDRVKVNLIINGND